MTTFNIETTKQSTLYNVLHTCSIKYSDYVDFYRRDKKYYGLRFVIDHFSYKFLVNDDNYAAVYFHRSDSVISLYVLYNEKSLYYTSITI